MNLTRKTRASNEVWSVRVDGVWLELVVAAQGRAAIWWCGADWWPVFVGEA